MMQRSDLEPFLKGEAIVREEFERLQILVRAIQELSLTRTMQDIAAVVRRASRKIAGSDGATFVLRDVDKCYYFDEDAIAPLWKGKRFPMSACISGWVMMNAQPALIEDIYVDERIPHDAYRPTFVQSLAMLPVRSSAPIAAIGNYWAVHHRPSLGDIQLLQALADSTSVAMENVRVYQELEDRVRDRTLALEMANHELEAFNYAVSHDLRTPLRTVHRLCDRLEQEKGSALDEAGLRHVARMRGNVTRMEILIQALLKLSRLSRAELHYGRVDVSELSRNLFATLREDSPERRVDVEVEPGIEVLGDAHLINIVLENLLSNAWKYTGKREQARIEVRAQREGEEVIITVRDNGAGFDMGGAGKLFGAFQRLHTESEFPGLGVGLATASRIVSRHGGRIWGEGAPDQGAIFHVALRPFQAFV